MKLLKIREVAQQLGLTYNTTYQRCKKGEIPYIMVGKSIRIKSTDLETIMGCQVDEYLEEHCLRNGLKNIEEDRVLEIIRQYLQTKFTMFEERDVFKLLQKK